jgi:hypothetical protein
MEQQYLQAYRDTDTECITLHHLPNLHTSILEDSPHNKSKSQTVSLNCFNITLQLLIVDITVDIGKRGHGQYNIIKQVTEKRVQPRNVHSFN